MSETQEKEYVTIELYKGSMASIDARFDSLETRMKEGFETVFSVLERIEYKLDMMNLNKADKEETFALHKRVSRIESKIF